MINTLIVEDESWVRKGLVKIIDWEGMDMVLAGEAENGEEALNLCKTRKPDLVITDMKMPKSSGIELLQKLAEINSGCEIIVISGYSDYEYMKQAIASSVFDYILKPIDETQLNDVLKKVKQKLEHKKSLEAKMDASRPILESNFLRTLLTRRPDNTEMFQDPAEIGLDLSFRSYSVIIAVFKAPPGKDTRNRQLFDRFTNEIFRLDDPEISFNAVVNLYSAYDVTILCKCSLTGINTLTNKQELICGRLNEMAEKELHADIRLGAGNWKTGYGNIADSFNEARAALKYEHMTGSDIIFYDSIRQSLDTEEELDFQFDERHLYFMMQNPDSEQITDLLKDLYGKAGEREYCRLSSFKKALIKFMIAFERCCKKIGINMGDGLAPEESYLDFIEDSVSIPGLQAWARSIVGKTLENIKRLKAGDNKDIVAVVKDYIDNNYQEDINLICTAQKFYLNHIYLSRVFKAQAGENFIDYLTRVRMEKAKELLQNGNLKIREISELVGYSNPYYFAKSFKKFYGYSPSEQL